MTTTQKGLSTQEMDRLARVREAGRAAGILMRMQTKRLGDRFTVPLQAVNAVSEADAADKNYGLHAERENSGDPLNVALYAAMAPHLLAAIEAAREALHRLVEGAIERGTR